jgi:hypothetical protein
MLCSLLIDWIDAEFQRGEGLWKVPSKYILLKYVLRKVSVEHRLTEKTGEISKVFF